MAKQNLTIVLWITIYVQDVSGNPKSNAKIPKQMQFLGYQRIVKRTSKFLSFILVHEGYA